MDFRPYAAFLDQFAAAGPDAYASNWLPEEAVLAGLQGLANRQVENGQLAQAVDLLEALVAELPDSVEARLAASTSLPIFWAATLSPDERVERLQRLSRSVDSGIQPFMDVALADALLARGGSAAEAQERLNRVSALPLEQLAPDLPSEFLLDAAKKKLRLLESLDDAALDLRVEWLDEGDGGGLSARGKRVLVVELFATWCRPCYAGLGEISRLSARPEWSAVEFVSIAGSSERGFLPDPGDPRRGEQVGGLDKSSYPAHLSAFTVLLGLEQRVGFARSDSTEFERLAPSIPVLLVFGADGELRLADVASGGQGALEPLLVYLSGKESLTPQP